MTYSGVQPYTGALDRGLASTARFNFPEPRQATLSAAIVWRLFDMLVATAVLIAVLPLLLILVAIMYIMDPGPVFFVHRRIGRHGRYFGCLKFRTMKINGDAILKEHLLNSPSARQEWETTQKLRNDPRITVAGKVVRKLSLDEFPQLINVLRGEMSIVGPRPIVEAEVSRYGPFFEYYCSVKPGLTGLWQTSGRNDTTYEERVQMDVDYAARKGLGLDLWLLVKTVPAVLLARGSY